MQHPARSPTAVARHERRPAGRSIAVARCGAPARGRAAEHHRVAPRRRGGSRRGWSEEKSPRCSFFGTIASSSSGSSRGSMSASDRPPEVPSGALLQPEVAPVLLGGPWAVKTTGRPFARATSSRRFVASTSPVRSPSARSVGEATAEVDRWRTPAAVEPSRTLSPRPAFASRAFWSVTRALPHGRSAGALRRERARLTNTPLDDHLAAHEHHLRTPVTSSSNRL